MICEVLFDISKNILQIGFIAIMGCLFICSVLLIKLIKKYSSNSIYWGRIVLFAVFIMSIITGAMLIVGLLNIPSRIKKQKFYKEIIINNEYKTIQGKIQSFHREQIDNDSVITLSIKSIEFSSSRIGNNYECYQVFNSLEGQLAKDLFIKVTYLEKDKCKLILKIERIIPPARSGLQPGPKGF